MPFAGRSIAATPPDRCHFRDELHARFNPESTHTPMTNLIAARSPRLALWTALAFTLVASPPARASFLHGDALDSLANGIAWVALIIAPIIGITVFWLIHILPEKIAHKRKHPQTGAIQCLCLLSLFFGGLLWPIAWLWAYSKPVLHRLAYGKDTDDAHGHEAAATTTSTEDASELSQLRARVAELEAKNKGGKA